MKPLSEEAAVALSVNFGNDTRKSASIGLSITVELTDMDVEEYKGHLQRQKVVVLEAAQKRKG
jgi:hypothetical protein